MKVAFLHPYKMADHYFVEALETATIADLVADGHDAEAADFLFDPARDEDEQLREMRAALDARGYELVFLERPWSDAVVRALAGLRVVAYACPELVERGLVELCIENTARRVVRELVATLARGGDPCQVPGLVYRRDGALQRSAEAPPSTVKGELHDADFAHGRRRQLSRGASNAERAVVLSNLGCAYRHVPNHTGIFDGVPMPADVSTAGCTFCSVAAYERMSEADAIRLIVRQIEAVLRDRPEVREIAVKDDYAVRFLAGLGDALRPLGLGERLVLFSARADYLLEFRSDIEAALAGRFPAPIGFYLIGFENFSQAELDRFNKGTSAAQLEAVARQMHDWSERFPGRFRVTPTGGFILFTPWTTLEDLRVNANAMRRLGFERFRGGALHSQLRLHPKQPLYWLAKRDELLVEAFERADLSDAHRRGYRVDHAWRFRDPKVGAVHRRLLDARGATDGELFAIFEDALDEAAGVARGKKARPLRMVPAPRDVGHAAPATTTLSVNRACNQSCSFCVYHGQEVEPPRMRAARAIQGVRAAAAEGARTLVLTGAEPTLEWYLPDLVRLARDLGLREVVLETNATLLGEPGRAAELREAGVTRAV
ncbi:MAG: radical SAM protein, partial [Polyangiaceae bacterium]|nr:radical SAM protein [Polyangiaceae bacterium]